MGHSNEWFIVSFSELSCAAFIGNDRQGYRNDTVISILTKFDHEQSKQNEKKQQKIIEIIADGFRSHRLRQINA
jgi:hypothetical protein